MRKNFFFVVVAIVLVSCQLPFTIVFNNPPTEAPPATPAPTEAVPPPTAAPTQAPISGTEMNLGGVYMVIPDCLPVVPTGAIEPAVPYDPNGGPMTVWPEHRVITFPGYPLTGKFFEPKMRVFPLANYPVINTSPADQISRLQALLAAKPAEVIESIPFLPGFNAAQVFHIKMEYLTFQNGEGVRFLTEYAQYYAPMNNHDLFYTFQGLTSDGKYWISAIFLVNHAILPESYDSTILPPGGMPIPQPGSPNFENEFMAYYDGMKMIMNGQPDDTFTPSLTCLDQYIQSLNIGD